MARAVLVSAAVLLALVFSEMTTRVVDGYKVFSIGLQRVREPRPTAAPDRAYLPAALADGVNPAWYEQTPPAPAVPKVDAAIAARAAAHPEDPTGPFFWWNAAFIREQLCGHKDGAPGTLDDFYLFEPADGKPYPRYRHLPHVTPPGWFTPNAFGWRGPEVSADRPAKTIRIAFVGASTTIGSYGSAFSHPEIIGYWLNLWAAARRLPYRFETINAARTGIEASSIEAIVRTEVLSADPDLVVYYEGANNFAPSWTLSMPQGVPARPAATFRARSRAEYYSALAGRVYDAILKSSHDGSEPSKPRFAFVWPAGVSEENPDVTHPSELPIAMDVVVKNLNAIRASLATTDAELALSSFVWLADEGMRLDLSRHLTLFRYLNETYWPLSYAHIHRMAAFENAVFRNYARTYHLTYLPMAESYPHDPDLFGDAIHLTERGLRLQAWMFFQQLIPIIESRIASGAWPKAPSTNSPSAEWAAQPRSLVTRASVLAACSQTVH
jgi:hypothetical protein